MEEPLHILEAARQHHTMSVTEFAAWLGLRPSFYQRFIRGEVELPDDRRLAIADQLDLSAENREVWLRPWPSVVTPERHAHLNAVIKEANEQGWICCDSDTLEPTGELLFVHKAPDGAGGWCEEVIIKGYADL